MLDWSKTDDIQQIVQCVTDMTGMSNTKSLSCKVALVSRCKGKRDAEAAGLCGQGVYVRGGVTTNGMPVLETPESPKKYPRRVAGAKTCEVLAKGYFEREVKKMQMEEALSQGWWSWSDSSDEE